MPVDRLTVMNDIFNGGEKKESQAVLKQVTRDTITKEQCRGACRSTYGDEWHLQWWSWDLWMARWRNACKKIECMQKKMRNQWHLQRWWKKESQAVLKQVTQETVTKEQCQGACRSTYGDEWHLQWWSWDLWMTRWRNACKKMECKKKKGIINALNKKKRPVVAQIHNTEINVKIWSFKLAPINEFSTWELHEGWGKACKKKIRNTFQKNCVKKIYTYKLQKKKKKTLKLIFQPS